MVVPRQVSSMASLIEECCTSKNLQKVLQLHCQTIKVGISYNDYIRAKLVSCYSSCAQMQDAHLMFSFTNRKSTFLYNTLIRGYASTKQFHLSLSSFHQMLLSRKPFDLNTLPAILKSVAALSFLRLGRQLHHFVLVHGLTFELAHCNALITMYAKCGDLHSARKVFDKMHKTNLISWCAMMGGYAMHGDFDEVFYLFDRILGLGVWPDGPTFTTVLTACSHGGRIDKGKECFEMMVSKFKLRPNMEHNTCMVDMLARAGRIKEAIRFVESMDMEPDEALWRVLLGSCRFHGNFEITVRGRCWRLTSE